MQKNQNIAVYAASFIMLAGFMFMLIWLLYLTHATFEISLPFWQALAGMKPNEIGDFLAGVFAPPAFCIVAAALIMQSRDLKISQSEMVLTREVFNEQSDLMQEQIAEAKRSADLFARQNDILVSQEEGRVESAKSEKIHDLLRRLDLHLRVKIVGKEDMRDQHGAPHAFFDEVSNSYDYIESLTRIIHGAMQRAAVSERQDQGELYRYLAVSYLNGVREAFHLAIWLMNKIVSLSEEAPEEIQSLVHRELRIPQFEFLFRLVANGPDQINDEDWSVWLNGSSRPPWAIDEQTERFPVYPQR